MNIVIVGLGIIGGSLAKAFTKYTDHRVIGINRSEATAKRAFADGAIHEIVRQKRLAVCRLSPYGMQREIFIRRS